MGLFGASRQRGGGLADVIIAEALRQAEQARGALVAQHQQFATYRPTRTGGHYTPPSPRRRDAYLHAGNMRPGQGGSATAYRPAADERIGDTLESVFRGVGIDPMIARRARDEAGMLPFLGDALTAVSGADDLNRGNYLSGGGQIGMAVLGAIPGVGDAAAAALKRGLGHIGTRHALEQTIDTAASAAPAAVNDTRAIQNELPSWAGEASSSNWRDLRAYAWSVRERLTGVQHPIDMSDNDIAYWVAVGRQRGALPDEPIGPAPPPFSFR